MMNPVTTRIPENDEETLAEPDEDTSPDRSGVLRQLIRQGLSDWRTERTLDQLRDHTITLRKAVELADPSYVEMLTLVAEVGIDVGYTTDEPEFDLDRIYVVVDSTALIPLAWVGRLDLVATAFDEVRTTEEVRAEVLTEGKRGTGALNGFLEGVAVHHTPAAADEAAAMDRIMVADTSVILLAEDDEEILLANDKGLTEVARSHGVECWWMTTLLLGCTRNGDLTADEATDLLYDLVDEGMNLHPMVDSQVQKRLREFED
jgi:predicted nucleic acid-binding protein